VLLVVCQLHFYVILNRNIVECRKLPRLHRGESLAESGNLPTHVGETLRFAQGDTTIFGLIECQPAAQV
jgi:hypothetical protein